MRLILAATGIALAVSACKERPNDPSPESKALQDRIIPQLVRWSEGDARDFRLFEVEGIKSFDYVCYRGEYQKLSESRSGDVRLRKYRGQTGDMVPENYTAVIGVQGDVGHIGYLDAKFLRIDGPVRCSRADTVVLLRQTESGTQWQSARFN